LLPICRAAHPSWKTTPIICIRMGTSFSAPLLAARFIRALLEGAAGSGLKLTPCGQLATANRAQAALKAMDWPG